MLRLMLAQYVLVEPTPIEMDQLRALHAGRDTLVRTVKGLNAPQVPSQQRELVSALHVQQEASAQKAHRKNVPQAPSVSVDQVCALHAVLSSIAQRDPKPRIYVLKSTTAKLRVKK